MIHPRHTLAECARVLVGVVFVLSGLLKAVDPMGTALKIGQYLAPVLDTHGAKGEVFTLALSFVLCGAEFLLGAFLLMGIYRKLCARLSCRSPILSCVMHVPSDTCIRVANDGCRQSYLWWGLSSLWQRTTAIFPTVTSAPTV